jgi:hypothetical protein
VEVACETGQVGAAGTVSDVSVGSDQVLRSAAGGEAEVALGLPVGVVECAGGVLGVEVMQAQVATVTFA